MNKISKNVVKLVILVMVFLSAMSVLAACNKNKTQINGNIVDQNRAAVSGAVVKYDGKEVATSDASGNFSFKVDVKNANCGEIESKINVEKQYLAFIKASCNNSTHGADCTKDGNWNCSIWVALGNPSNPNPTVELAPISFNPNYNPVRGYVRTLSYEYKGGVEVYFGESGNKKLAAVSKSDGSFEFSYNAPMNFDHTTAVSKISANVEGYAAQAFSDNINGSTNAAVILAEVGSTISTIHKTIFLKTTFRQDGIKLPAGYVHRGEVLQEGAVSQNGETILSGVKVYVDGNLVGSSDSYGIDLKFVTVNSEIKFEYEGFTFYSNIQEDADFLQGDKSVLSKLLEEGHINADGSVMLTIRCHTTDSEILMKQI